MIQYFERIEYLRGIFEKGMKPEALPVKVWQGFEIPADIWPLRSTRRTC